MRVCGGPGVVGSKCGRDQRSGGGLGMAKI